LLVLWEALLLCLVHFIACSGTDGAADVLVAASCASFLVVGLTGPWLRLLPPSQLCDGGEFTATAATVASSSTACFRWVSGLCSVIARRPWSSTCHSIM
jgi:hypothetical protein